jgi:Ca2+-binding EF-hand superfamily protein
MSFISLLSHVRMQNFRRIEFFLIFVFFSLIVDHNTFEQLYYLFRNLCGSSEKDKAAPESFSNLFPAMVHRNVIRYLFRMFLDSDTAPLDFASFISTLSVINAGSPTEKLKRS